MCRIALKMFEHRSWIVGNATVGTNESTPVRGEKTDALKIRIGDNMSGAIELKRVRLCLTLTYGTSYIGFIG